jgi:hypothetical protein
LQICGSISLSTALNCKKTYAAVAAKISTLRALVAIAREKQNKAVNAQTKPNLALPLTTNERTTIDTNGANEEKTVPRIFVTASMFRSS